MPKNDESRSVSPLNERPHVDSPESAPPYRFGVLLAALFIMLVYQPLVDLVAPRLQPLAARVVVGVVFTWLMLAAAFAVSESRRSRIILLLLALPGIVMQLADVSLKMDHTRYAGHALSMLFLGYVIFLIVRYILRCEQITPNTIFASLCVYLLLGVFWALIYSFIEHTDPSSFSYPIFAGEGMEFGNQSSLAIYYSYVTMTTLGYGDIVPLSSAARAATSVQAITGQLYLTVLVAWLVGMYIVHSRSDAE